MRKITLLCQLFNNYIINDTLIRKKSKNYFFFGHFYVKLFNHNIIDITEWYNTL